MKIKVDNVVIGVYGYDSIIANIDGNKTEIVFNKDANVEQYKGKEIELVNEKGVFKIKPLAFAKKND